MRISVFGLGYVGCVSAACLARDGHEVIGVEVSSDKVETTNSGKSPILEPGVDDLIREMVQAGKLTATQDGTAAILATDVSLITVGTPSNHNGSIDLTYIRRVSQNIGEALASKDDYHVIIERSTVLPGTMMDTVVPLLEEHSGKSVGRGFGISMNPEFLREGSAIGDYDNPEMVKYVYNTFHAVKIAYANEVGKLCKAHKIDGREVMGIFCRDRELNISAAYLKPGFAFGGSCLPKDTRALKYRAKELDIEIPLLDAVLSSSQRQIERGIEMVERTGRKKIGVPGLSFKSGTDDVRESPVVPLIETLVGRGYHVRVYDQSIELGNLIGANKLFLERGIPHISSLVRPTAQEVASHADVVVLTPAFGEPPSAIRDGQTLIDLNGSAEFNGTLEGRYDGICW